MPAALADAIRDAVLTAPGPTDRGLRDAVMHRAAEVAGLAVPDDGPPLPAELAPLVDKILTTAYRIRDRDIEALRAAGWTDDALYDVIVAAAAGAGLTRLARGLELMD